MSFVSVVTALAPYAWYRCNEASGTTLVDASTNARNGTLSGTFTLQQSGFANDGNHSILSTANTFFNLTSGSTQPGNSASTAFSLAFIYKPGVLSTAYLASAQNGDSTHNWQLVHDATASTLSLSLNSVNIMVCSDSVIPLSSNGGSTLLWLQYDGVGTWGLYVNGSSTPVASATGKPITQNGATFSLIIDGSTGNTNLSAVGNYQDIMIFTPALSAANRASVFTATGITPAFLAGVTSASNLPTGVSLSWTTAGVGGVSPYSYQLYRLTSSTSSVSSGALVYSGTTTSYLDDPGDYGLYYYIVRSTDSVGQVAQNIIRPGQKQKSYAILAIGDSRTLGANADFSSGGDPVTQLAFQLDSRLGNSNFNIINRGASGAMASHWVPGNKSYPGTQAGGAVRYTFNTGTDSLFDTALAAFQAAITTYPAGTQCFVQIMLGANESTLTQRVTPAQYTINMRAIIAGIKAANIPGFAGIILHCSYYAVPYFNPAAVSYDELSNNLMAQYNAALFQLVDNITVFMGDTKAYAFFAAFGQGAFGLLGVDGVHPTDSGYSAQATLWTQAYQSLFFQSSLVPFVPHLSSAIPAYANQQFSFNGTSYNSGDPVFDPNFTQISADIYNSRKITHV
jgi:lysophospholipase L1-like esterase